MWQRRTLVPSSNNQAVADVASSELGGVRVLVVEDALHLASALKGLLERVGVEVVGPVATVSEAKHLAAARMAQVAVVDVKLRGESADGLIDTMHSRGVPVIVVSGYPVPPRLAEKTVAILQKPFFSGPQLVAAVQQAVRMGRAANQQI
jgi:DNA-binding NtrC family response regulator